MKSEFTPFPSIEGFAHAVQNQKRRIDLYDNQSVLYVLKPKLHGTNAAVRIDPDGSIQAQSRKRNITVDDDNFEFAAFVEDYRDYFSSLALSDETLIVFGEWAGRGVQSTDAVNKLEDRIFFPFAVQIGDRLHSNIETIEQHLGDGRPVSVMNLPAIGYVEINFSENRSIQNAVDDINNIVVEFEDKDPFIFDMFGIEDVGEGIVGCPIFDDGIEADTYRNLSFKAKTQNHRGRKAKAAATGRFEISGDAQDMALSYLTDARFEQALHEALGGVPDIKQMGAFLSWVGTDVKKESAAELEAAGIEWKAIANIIARGSADWLKRRIAEEPIRGAA